MTPQTPPSKIAGSPLAIFALVADLLTVLVGAIFAFYARFSHFNFSERYELAIAIGLLATSTIFSAFGIYTRQYRNLISRLWHLSLAWLTVSLILAILAFGTQSGAYFSRYWAFFWVSFAMVLLVSGRILVRVTMNYLVTHGFNRKRVIIVGAGVLGANVFDSIVKHPNTGYDVVAFWDDSPQLHGEQYRDKPVYKPEDGFEQITIDTPVDEIWFALPLRAEARMREILYLLRHHTATIRMVPDIFGFRLLNHSMTEIAGIPVINLNDSPIIGINRILKTIEDMLLGTIIVLLASPIMLIIAIGVKLSSPGPVFFRQLRHGFDGKPIKVYKFRTMKLHAENSGIVTQARKDDDRVTPFGRFLRKTSLDELPQFVNVLQGRMSIVGPRPHAIEHNEHYKDQVEAYMQRHRVKPGITGLAQIKGCRGETDTLDKMQKRIEYDLLYIENWSIWMDFRIIVITALLIFFDRNAY